MKFSHPRSFCSSRSDITIGTMGSAKMEELCVSRDFFHLAELCRGKLLDFVLETAADW